MGDDITVENEHVDRAEGIHRADRFLDFVVSVCDVISAHIRFGNGMEIKILCSKLMEILLQFGSTHLLPSAA